MFIDSPQAHYDVAIIGGGMVGSNFALMLANACAKANLSLLIIEASKLSKDLENHNGFDARSTALSYGSSKILDDAGIWESLSTLVAPIESIVVSDKGRFGKTELACEDYDLDALGYVVENRDLGRTLYSALEKSDTIQHLSPAKVLSLKPTQEGMNVVIESKGAEFSLSTSLTVLADGGRSPLCEQLGIVRESKDYQQHALIANIAFEKPHNNRAFERFTETGPLAVLPLNQQDGLHRASLVWTVLESEVEELKALPNDQLVRELQSRFGDRLGQISKIGELIHYPLSLVTSREQIRPGLALLGNVAHTLHPVAGQGLNLALRDAKVLAEVLSDVASEAQLLGSMETLQKYLDKQSLDQRKSIAATDGLTKLFSNNDLLKVWMRKVGLVSLELMPRAKRTFAKHAMGLAKA